MSTLNDRARFDAAFLRAIDRQETMVAHTPGWKPLIDLVWEELQASGPSVLDALAGGMEPIVKDALRYRHLREHWLRDLLWLTGTTDTSDVGLDYAIDAAIRSATRRST